MSGFRRGLLDLLLIAWLLAVAILIIYFQFSRGNHLSPAWTGEKETWECRL